MGYKACMANLISAQIKWVTLGQWRILLVHLPLGLQSLLGESFHAHFLVTYSYLWLVRKFMGTIAHFPSLLSMMANFLSFSTIFTFVLPHKIIVMFIPPHIKSIRLMHSHDTRRMLTTSFLYHISAHVLRRYLLLSA